MRMSNGLVRSKRKYCHNSSTGCKTPVTAVSDKSKTFQEDEKTVYFSIRVTKQEAKLSLG